MVSLLFEESAYLFSRSGKGAQISEECFNTSESKQNASKLFPA
jgi:hypothetical protein